MPCDLKTGYRVGMCKIAPFYIILLWIFSKAVATMSEINAEYKL